MLKKAIMITPEEAIGRNSNHQNPARIEILSKGAKNGAVVINMFNYINGKNKVVVLILWQGAKLFKPLCVAAY